MKYGLTKDHWGHYTFHNTPFFYFAARPFVSSGNPLLTSARKPLAEVAQALYRLVMDVCLQPMKRNLDDLHNPDVSFPEKHGASLFFAFLVTSASDKMPYSPNLQIWTSKQGDDAFSLSPSNYIAKIGELLLTLPQQLETFAAAVRCPGPVRDTSM